MDADLHHLPRPLQAITMRARERARAVPLAMRVLLIGAAFAVAGYFCVTDTGPYRLFRSGPSQDFTHRYFYFAAAIETMLVCLAPAAALVFAIGSLRQRRI